MSKLNNPLKSNVLASLEALEADERAALQMPPEETVKEKKVPPKTPVNAPRKSPSRFDSESPNHKSLDDLSANENDDENKFVTRNYSFLASVDTDIDRLRMALKKRGRKYTKQELVNTLLRERLQQLEEKNVF